MKKWEIPKIESLVVTATAWETLDGEEPDLYEYYCDPLYKKTS